MSRNRKAASLPLIVSSPSNIEAGMCVIMGIPPLCENSPKKYVIRTRMRIYVSIYKTFIAVSLGRLSNKQRNGLTAMQCVIISIHHVSYFKTFAEGIIL